MFLADLVNHLGMDLLNGIWQLFHPMHHGSIFDAFSQVSCGAVAPPGTPPPPPTAYSCGDECGGSAFSKEAAAFGTLGYYAQASWLIQIFDFGLQKIAIIGYVISAAASLYGFALGNTRPQKFLWFLIGPPICWFLIAELTPVRGVEWRVGNQYRNMQEVWALTEPGLANEDYVIRNGIAVSSNKPPFHSGFSLADLCYFPTGPAYACVSDFFAYYDSLLSDVVQQLVAMLGINRAVDRNPLVADKDTNITWGHTGGGGSGDPNALNNRYKWDLISSLRWDFFAGITDARIKDPNLRRAFATFLASDCGTEFMKGIDKARMTASAKKGTPFSVTPVMETSPSTFNYDAATLADCWDVEIFAHALLPIHYSMWDDLKSVIPTPEDVVSLMEPGSSLAKQSNIEWISQNTGNALFGPGGGIPGSGFPIQKIITCRSYLIILMQGLRWEAAHTAYQLETSGPAEIAPLDYLTMMFYGWSIKDAVSGDQISSDQLPAFVEALVLGHLFRNELEVAPGQFIEKRYLTTGEQTIQNVKDFQRLNNARSKYGELYAWALMVPYFQGKLLYFLAIAYPFAAMFVVVPGMGKIFIQWLQFWAWVKLWDLGFGLVMVIERSVWAMTANTARNGEVAKVGWQILSANRSSVCTPLNHPLWNTGPGTPPKFVPDVAVQMFHGLNPGGAFPLPPVAKSYETMLCTLDRLLAMSNNTDLDLTNSYYIYIMTALYFAVPAVTGQIVLGAKAGAASMITGAMSSISQPAGGAASNAATSEWGRRAKENQAIASQQAFGSALAKGGNTGLAGQVLSAQNEGAMAQMEGTSFQARSQAMQGYASAIQGLMSPAYTKNGEVSTAFGALMTAARFPLNSAIRRVDTNAAFEGAADAAGMRGQPISPNDLTDGANGPRGSSVGFGGSGLRSGTSGPGSGLYSGRQTDPEKLAQKRRLEGFGDVMNIANQMGAWAMGANLAGFVRDVATDSTKANASATDFGMQASGRQMDGQIANMGASRLEAKAGFQAESAAWSARANYADKMTDKMAAVTGSAESLNPGQRPTNMMGMAMGGMLDRGSVGSDGKVSMGSRLSEDANAASRSYSGISASGKELANKTGTLRADAGKLKNDFMYAKDANGNTMVGSDGKPMTVGQSNFGAFQAGMATITSRNYFQQMGENISGPMFTEAMTGKVHEQTKFGLGRMEGGVNVGRQWTNHDNPNFKVPLSTKID